MTSEVSAISYSAPRSRAARGSRLGPLRPSRFPSRERHAPYTLQQRDLGGDAPEASSLDEPLVGDRERRRHLAAEQQALGLAGQGFQAAFRGRRRSRDSAIDSSKMRKASA